MPRLPDFNDLGARPVPVSRRSIASNPRAGAVGEALAGFGNRVQQLGERGLQRAREKEDKLAYASARSALIRADIETRRELAEDPDFDTWETRYNERMSVALGDAAKGISSSADRALFEQDAGIDILRGSAELATGARARRVDTEIASANDQLFEMQDMAQDAPDDAAREAIIGNANELIAGLQEKGYLSAKDASDKRREWTQNYIVQRIEGLRNIEDYDGAERFFEANRGRLDAATETRVAGLLTDALDNRESLILAEAFVHGAIPATGDVPSGDAPAPLPTWASPVSSELQRAGFPAPVVAGFLGNFDVEGGHGGAQGDGGTASGIAQWRHERRANFKRMFGKEPHQASAAEQARFVVWEMQNPREAGMTAAQRDAILAADTPEKAAALIDQYYERSSGQHRGRREQSARAFHGGVAATATGPQRHDLRQINSTIDARAEAEGWTPEKTERIKAQAARLVQRDDALLDREQADAYDAALAKAEALGDGFTDPSQLGDAYYRASEQQQSTLRNMAEANLRAATAARTADANGDVVRALHRMQIDAPGQFANADLRPYRPFMTPAEYDEVVTQQARVKEQAGQWSPRTGIQTAITWGDKFGGVKLEDDEDRYRVYRYMEGRAQQFRAESKGRDPAESDYQRWFGEATAETRISRSFAGIDVLLPDQTIRAFETAQSSAFRKQIIRDFKAVNGREPNEAEIQQWFDRMGEAIR